MQGHKPHFIVFVRRANRHKCVVFARRTRTTRNFLAGPGNEHARAVECVWIVRVKPGAGGDAASARCSKQCPLLNHGWRSIVRVMVTKSAATAKQRREENGTEMTTERPAEVHGQQDNSNGRQRAVQATTDVAAASVKRKRKTEQDTAQMQEAPPDAKQRREDGRTERSTERQAEMSCKQQSKGRVWRV